MRAEAVFSCCVGMVHLTLVVAARMSKTRIPFREFRLGFGRLELGSLLRECCPPAEEEEDARPYCPRGNKRLLHVRIRCLFKFLRRRLHLWLRMHEDRLRLVGHRVSESPDRLT